MRFMEDCDWIAGGVMGQFSCAGTVSLQGDFQSSSDPKKVKNCYSICRKSIPKVGISCHGTSFPLITMARNISYFYSSFPIAICHQTCLCCAQMAPAPILSSHFHPLQTKALSVYPLQYLTLPTLCHSYGGLYSHTGGMGLRMGAGREAVQGGVKERQANVGLPDLGCLSGLSPRVGWVGERRSEEKGGESRMKDKEVA